MNASDRYRLVSLPESPVANPSALLQQLLEHLLNSLVPSLQPQVRAYRTRHGQPAWSVYDPLSRTTRRFDNETAVREWLEQRYNQ